MKVELSIHANNLRNVAGAFGTSDPFVTVTKLATEHGTKPEVIGKSETIKNTLNPNWVTVFVLDYELGQTTKVAVSIFDQVKNGSNKSMGVAVFDIAEVLAARGSTKSKKLRGGGTVFVHARKSTGSGVLRLKMNGIGLKNVEGGLFGKSDPFFEISRKIDAAGGQTWDNIYRSEVIRNNLNPEWKELVIELSILCGGDLSLPIQIAVYDYESSGKHVSMGQLETNVNGLKAAMENGTSLTLENKKKVTGEIVVSKADLSGVDDLTQKPQTSSLPTIPAPVPTLAPTPVFSPDAVIPQSVSFLDYIAGGCKLNVAVAIDFTGSNGDPRLPGTLHHISPYGIRNDYEKAIAAVVSILAKYDSDKKFPVYGFGAKFNGSLSHCFQCGSKPEHIGVAGVLDAYHQVFSSGLTMSGPTVFTEVIETVADRAERAQRDAMLAGEQCYTILLIVTDGAVSDVQATAACLERVSRAPLSVVIVGVGNNDFRAMQFLDDFSGPGQRDIAQFVEFNKHSHSSQSLTSETLDEIPEQLTNYFLSMGISPRPAVIKTESEVSIESSEEVYLKLDIGDGKPVVTAGGDDFVDGFNATR